MSMIPILEDSSSAVQKAWYWVLAWSRRASSVCDDMIDRAHFGYAHKRARGRHQYAAPYFSKARLWYVLCD